jgi:hypothetical protein
MAMLINGLKVLRAEFDTVNPNRDHSSDGWIGDDRHAVTISDHNPDSAGIVHAIDVDVDGVPMARIVAWIVARCKNGQETRLQYVIFRRTIWSRSWGWNARAYTGVNPHTKHAHFSARYADVAGDSTPWGIAAVFGPKAATAAAHPTESAPATAHPAGSRRLTLRDPALSGADVAYVQRWIGSARAGVADGRYGPGTVAGVAWYQRMRGLTADGIVGPATWRNMGVRWTGGS